ncbi:cleavage stimulation factor subunit 2-like [Dorcoceras hygrometricum]|uniref:Cleavage stimulation factor subunit 2-like n=1 Tax=Dorcoceras hygrometricum TaxID=472368 RepID=A0A2Z7B0X2_9LAMI|nr:cleavage stimulation factor subunit 2-like [Dorcoceras hygrometricum]
MSLLDLQDVCIAIGSIATLDLPMVFDLIGIYGLKGPYCTLTTTNWFLQALSVIPMGSWGDVARRFTMIRWASPELLQPPPLSSLKPPPCAPPPPPPSSPEIRSGKFDEENPSAQISSRLLVQGIQLAVGPQPLRLRNNNFGLAHRIMVKRLATSPHDPIGITDSACKNQLVVVSVQYGPFNTYIPIRSTTIGKSRVARDPIAMHTSWRSNSDIVSVTRQTHLPKTHPVLWPEIYHTIISSDSIGHPRIKASGESSTTKHRLLHASGPHPILPPNDPN